MAQRAKSDLNVYEKIDRLENAITAILEKLELPKLETFHDKSTTKKAEATTPQQPVKPVKIEIKPYEYEKLDPNSRQIRLLELAPLNDSVDDADAITGSLKICTLGKLQDFTRRGYNALSYTWGEPVMDTKILIDGRSFLITKSLRSALASMSRRKYPRTNLWWIDQICINQTDTDERNHQVSMMREIYKTANIVSAWLEDARGDAKRAVETIKMITKRNSREPGKPAIEYPVLNADEIKRNWNALDNLFNSPWWERCWVRQEATLNESISIHYGDYEITFNELDNLAGPLDYIKQLGFKPPLEGGMHSITQSMAFFRDILQMRADSDEGRKFMIFSDLLRKTKPCKATNPRDKVYSLLGLIDDEKYSVSIDYRLPVEKVVRNATSATFEAENKLLTLGLCQNPERINGLPSWVPNLVDAWKARPFDKTGHGALRDKETKNAEIEGEVLKVHGFLYQTLDQICDVVVPENATNEQLEAVLAGWQGFVDKIEGYKGRYTNQNSMYALTCGLASCNKDHLEYWEQFLSIGTSPNIPAFFPRTWVPPELESLGRGVDTKSIRSCLVGPDFNYAPKQNAEALEYLYKYGLGRRLGMTVDGTVGLFPASAQIGDTIALIRAAPMPCLLRKVDESADHLLVDEVHLVRITVDGDRRLEPIRII